MNCILTRTLKRADGIFGVFSTVIARPDIGMFVPGEFTAYTLEHAYRDDSGEYVAKLPAGSYTCKRGKHMLHGMTAPVDMFEVMNVPGHAGILLHWGNFNSDSEGCVLLGRAIAENSTGDKMITSSRATFASFMFAQRNTDQFNLEVV